MNDAQKSCEVCGESEDEQGLEFEVFKLNEIETVLCPTCARWADKEPT